MEELTIPLVGISRLRPGTDGKGLRTLILVSGCPLRCKYCLNPESWDGSIEPKRFTKKQLYNRIKQDNLYFLATGGGITFGGGEPGLYTSFIREFIKEYCNDWNVALETSAHIPFHDMKSLTDVIDHFFIDIKSSNRFIYQKYTGKKQSVAFDNINYLSKVCPEKVTIRVPLIPEYNDKDECLETIRKMKEKGLSVDPFVYSVKKDSELENM